MSNITGDYISMDGRRQYAYTKTATSTQDITGTWKGYDIQTVSLQPDDVLLVHISCYMDLDDCNQIMETLHEAFPNNKCLLCNEHILKGLTIIRPEDKTKINNKVDIVSTVDIDKMFEELLRGNPNDFLY